MHRFNLCHDLLDRAGSVEGLALLLVWLRFSAIRQLDWQRRYNTKPRELSHAQDRLTRKLALTYGRMGGSAEAQELLRLMMASLGRGGEGQRVRDEILNIMHRHHIKEVAGHFMEEWHQKLHNNTTPDDMAICEAYVDFLRSDGDVALFYRKLERQGVSRERLEGFERPIVTPPDFVPHLKDALIHDFEGYLGLLRSVHSGTDLESAFSETRHLLDGELTGIIEDIRRGQDDPRASASLAGEIARARALLHARLGETTEDGHIRDLLYLDLSLEEFFRVVIEGSAGKEMEEADLYALVTSAVQNVIFSCPEDEFELSLSWWEKLLSEPGLSRHSRDWALHARAVSERLGRALGSSMDRRHRLLQPMAEYLGGAFHADRWTVTLFSEEIVRGLPAFSLSQTLRRLDPLLRKRAELGNWQIISPATATGRVVVVEDLGSVHAMDLDEPTVVLAGRVRGDEEPSPEVRAVITSQPTDIVSHVAVRARNSALLFAVCYDEECMEKLRAAKGRTLTLSVTNTGDVEFHEAEAAPLSERMEPVRLAVGRPDFGGYAITEDEFSPSLVGGKSLNSRALKGGLPGSIDLPSSAAIPFGVFEAVMEDERNREVGKACDALLETLNHDPEAGLAGLRAEIGKLAPPEDFEPSLAEALTRSGMPVQAESEEMWRCIKHVWASKWNLRAYMSRKSLGIPHDDLLMAVLIQEAVRPDYAFVIHTVNPFTKDPEELYAELVPGLGETLVGNHPGRALGFTSGKRDPKPFLLSYPSKSTALSGGGLIFRSDSNGEDLAGYAGAGLYDSVFLTEPEAVSVDYTRERLLWDEAFRDGILRAIAEAGREVEEAAGAPQDIEGTYAGGRITVVQTRPQVGL
jgi:alpha-glucan,water dikinase